MAASGERRPWLGRRWLQWRCCSWASRALLVRALGGRHPDGSLPPRARHPTRIADASACLTCAAPVWQVPTHSPLTQLRLPPHPGTSQCTVEIHRTNMQGGVQHLNLAGACGARARIGGCGSAAAATGRLGAAPGITSVQLAESVAPHAAPRVSPCVPTTAPTHSCMPKRWSCCRP